jgi:formate dehydrogenase subunit gamma
VDLVSYVLRFTRTERTFHWVNAVFFLFLAATGLVLYIPRLSELVGRRPLLKNLHFWGGIAWICALAFVFLLGDSRRLLRTVRELEVLRDDRFDVGQKLNAIVTAAFTVLFLVSGVLLWLGERDTSFRFASTVVLHDVLLYVALALFVGHLYLAVFNPAPRHALRGMTLGTVEEDWARRRHPEWETPPAAGGSSVPARDAVRT